MVTVSVPTDNPPIFLLSIVCIVCLFIANSLISSEKSFMKSCSFLFLGGTFVSMIGIAAFVIGSVGNEYEKFDNPVVAKSFLTDNNSNERIDFSNVDFDEGKLRRQIIETADLEKITEMRSGDGYYKTLSNGDEIKFKAEQNNTEFDGTVSYTDDSIVVKIVDDSGEVKTFTDTVV